MIEKLVDLDKTLFVFLNGLGSKTFDGFWLFITNQFNLIPLYLVVFYFLYKKIGIKKLLYVFLFLSIMILICDQSANIFKYTTQRLRPCNDPEIKDTIRVVKHSITYSFFSGHATNSMASTVFVFLIIRRFYKHMYWLFLFPLIFAYSRIYLGLHFPIDILTGFIYGSLFGFLFYKIYQRKFLNDSTQR